MRPKPLALIIMDGWGENPEKKGNAIKLADTPYIDSLFQKYPHTLIEASGKAVGLPEGQMGNSEVGHLNIGSGRIVYQDFTRISMAIESGEIFKNPVLKSGMEHAKAKGKALHLMGLLSDGGVHSHIDHLFGLLKMAKELEVEEVYIHAILDGRDTPPKSAKKYVQALEEKINELNVGTIATVSGRYYTMDRDQRWDRIEKSYRAMVFGEGKTTSSAIEAVEQAYASGETDEFVTPTVVVDEKGSPRGTIKEGDTVIFYNFRADRARQITRALALPEFDAFDRGKYLNLHYICMTEYDETFNLPIAFPPEEIKGTLAEVLSTAGLKQLRIAETEKYAHVTFFFNGGKEEPVEGEERRLIPSPKVATYDQKPSMSAFEVTDALIEEINKDIYDVIILNYANCDMVGHTGDLDAAIKAAEAVDQCLAKLIPIILDKGGQVLLTADHGNAEKMLEGDNPHTAHTTYPVPMIYIGGPEGVKLREGGILADIAPTMLEILGIGQPEEMTGKSLLVK
ncbi:phosphoglycerate mutase (2,3-diphosphoglycerate-independent) [Anoxybacter fermentans]|uniref:2,3-bisphosphoglycerate-independent phosphoglycerate mutase n=1 Tax=Anoxybacter fermentans TaxID=1323375 RepID=A0A3S9SVK6_9FIRM|nr:2,3-bisphosphoglycerate-independent phosphoglycerate mutase [Anoxybacter fermentans]AZR72280.1 phosphoglycerate mutase (2,3-diphosphoglycerate-independent) [Anoxybacter fermentans]